MKFRTNLRRIQFRHSVRPERRWADGYVLGSSLARKRTISWVSLEMLEVSGVDSIGALALSVWSN
jgi:hypothetical protein